MVSFILNILVLAVCAVYSGLQALAVDTAVYTTLFDSKVEKNHLALDHFESQSEC